MSSHEPLGRHSEANGNDMFSDDMPSQFMSFEELEEHNQFSSSKEEIEFNKLIEDCEKELYPGCTRFSKLSFILHLFHLKCMYGWSTTSFSMLLKLLNEAFPQMSSFPSTWDEAKKFTKQLGLGNEKIHACPNDCMLYWGDNVRMKKCNTCQTSRWKKTEIKEGDTFNLVEHEGKPAKVLRYFPLIPRLKRIFMSSKAAKDMIWHDKERENDGILRHPADGLAWKKFDHRYPEFTSDPRSVRFGLATDGFNPFRLMNSTYSTWPVVLIPYNLPPWLCMKRSSMILSLIIPGPRAPGTDIDVCLQPLIHELKLLWEGVDAFDAFKREAFKLKAALMCTINEFPAYANLSGWTNKGYYACPSCAQSTHSLYLPFGRKICYMGHHRWLSDDHPFRLEADLFYGTIETRKAPSPVSGSIILREQERISFNYGKSEKASKKRTRDDMNTSAQLLDDVDNSNEIEEFDDDLEVVLEEDQRSTTHELLWKKRSIFFNLEYWEHNGLRHNLDVMHTEKNVCDNLLGTFLNLEGKSRDNEKAKKDLQNVEIRAHLWLIETPNKKPYIPPAEYTMSFDDKERFLKVLKYLKVPDAYASNISRCVNLKDRKFRI